MFAQPADLQVVFTPELISRAAECVLFATYSDGRLEYKYAGGLELVRDTLRFLGQHRDAELICEFVRCVSGNPFRPVEFLSAWRTSTVVGLARGMYESRDFGAMPVLADALEEAGCDAVEVLAHCRGPGPHCRGCWVVDAVLGRA